MPEKRGVLSSFGEPFATGVARFLDALPEISEPLARIYVKLLLEGSEVALFALLDTGGHYLVLNQEVAESIQPGLTESLGKRTLHTSRGTIRGDLYTHRVTFLAEEGDHLDVETVLFRSPDWQGPNILGYSGGLDRFQLAISPNVNRWYFGSFESSDSAV